MFSTWGPGITSQNELDTNHWHHIAVTTAEDKGSSLSVLYIDGSKSESGHVQIDTEATNVFYLGGLPPAVEKTSYPYISRKLDGEIRDVSFYEEALTPENIKFIYMHEKNEQSTP
jgi:hypothetical protein